MIVSLRCLVWLGVAVIACATGLGQPPETLCKTLAYGPADAVVASPLNHTVLFEDADVRVLDVHSKPHTRETVHTHLLPSVMYFEHSGAGDYDSADGSVHRSHATDPNFKPEVRAIKPEGPHYTTNTGDVPFHAIRVEFRHPGCGLAGWKAAAARPDDALNASPTSPAVLFENDEVRVLDVRLAAGAKDVFYRDLWPAIFYVAEASPVRVSFVKQDALAKELKLVDGSVTPVDANVLWLENVGNGPLHLIWFELKYGSSTDTQFRLGVKQ